MEIQGGIGLSVTSEATMRATSRQPETDRPGLRRFAWVTVFYTVLVIVWGALVRASGSGAGCGNHWPLCNGQVVPVSPGVHTIIEFTHRMMTTGSACLVIALLVWTFRATGKNHAARYFAGASFALLLNEALLGALLVKLNYVTSNESTGRVVLLAIHLSNTLLLLAALTLTARFARTSYRWGDLRSGRGIAWGISGAAATIAVGVSGSLAALGDTLFPAGSLSAAFGQDFAAGSPVLLRLRLIHPVSAILAGGFVVWLAVRSRRMDSMESRGKHRAGLVLGLLGLQFVLGIADVLLMAPAWMQLIHLFGADLYWVALVLLGAETIWLDSAGTMGPAGEQLNAAAEPIVAQF